MKKRLKTYYAHKGLITSILINMHNSRTTYMTLVSPVVNLACETPCLRGGANKSLSQHTSWFRKTESVGSLERGVCSSADWQALSCLRAWKEECQATLAISTTSRREISSGYFYSCQTKHRRKFTSFYQILGENAPPSKTGWPSLNLVIFPPVMDDQIEWTPRRLLIKFTSLPWKTAEFRLNQ